MSIILRTIVFSLTVLTVGAAWPHSWYDPECCSSRDCEPVKGWKQVGNNYVMANGDVIPWSETREGKDEDFHLCLHITTKKRLCAYRPLSGS